jgi:hypothetical protein
MLSPHITTALAVARDADIARDVARRVMPIEAREERPAPEVTIRLAQPEDARALGRLAALDGGGTTGWEYAEVLVAESHGAMVAARALRGRAAIADPFRPAGEVLALLDVRARQLNHAAGHRLHFHRVPRPSGLSLRAGGAR